MEIDYVFDLYICVYTHENIAFIPVALMKKYINQDVSNVHFKLSSPNGDVIFQTKNAIIINDTINEKIKKQYLLLLIKFIASLFLLSDKYANKVFKMMKNKTNMKQLNEFMSSTWNSRSGLKQIDFIYYAEKIDHINEWTSPLWFEGENEKIYHISSLDESEDRPMPKRSLLKRCNVDIETLMSYKYIFRNNLDTRYHCFNYFDCFEDYYQKLFYRPMNLKNIVIFPSNITFYTKTKLKKKSIVSLS